MENDSTTSTNVNSMDHGRLSPAWRAELDARVKRRESGETRSHSREEVHQEIEALLA